MIDTPECPICGGAMTLRRPRTDQTWETFWGCKEYPSCIGARGIDENGNAIYSDKEREEILLAWI